MNSNARTVVEDLHRMIGDADLDHLANQPVRHRIPMPMHLDVIIEAGAAALPLGVFERLVG